MNEAQLNWERGVARLGGVARLWKGERRSSAQLGKEVKLNWERGVAQVGKRRWSIRKEASLNWESGFAQLGKRLRSSGKEAQLSSTRKAAYLNWERGKSTNWGKQNKLKSVEKKPKII